METERLLLRPYEESDFEFYASLWGNPDVVRYIGVGRTRTKEECLNRFVELRKINKIQGSTGLLLAIDKESGEYIGHAGLVPQLVCGRLELEIGYWIAQSYWGKGFASELAIQLRDYGFDTLAKKRLVSIIQYGNKASIAVAKKAGLTFEREVYFGFKDCALYSISC
jgi:RimJ/RimL family protein N-acetyltransferase